MGEGAEGEDEIQFLRTVSVLLPRVRFAQCGCGWRGRNLPHSTFFPPHELWILEWEQRPEGDDAVERTRGQPRPGPWWTGVSNAARRSEAARSPLRVQPFPAPADGGGGCGTLTWSPWTSWETGSAFFEQLRAFKWAPTWSCSVSAGKASKRAFLGSSAVRRCSFYNSEISATMAKLSSFYRCAPKNLPSCLQSPVTSQWSTADQLTPPSRVVGDFSHNKTWSCGIYRLKIIFLCFSLAILYNCYQNNELLNYLHASQIKKKSVNK